MALAISIIAVGLIGMFALAVAQAMTDEWYATSPATPENWAVAEGDARWLKAA